MNLVLLFDDDFIHGTSRVRLQGRRLKHITQVHRAKPGDILSVGLENGLIGQGMIRSMDKHTMDLDVTLSDAPAAGLPLNLILALPRPKALSRLISSITSLGVKHIWLIHAARVEKSYWHSPKLSDESIRKQMVLGLEQSKDTHMPRITLKKRFKPFVEDELPDIIKGTQAYLAHPRASKPCPASRVDPVTLIIGPEGGFIPYEVDLIASKGCQSVHLGDRILRVETVLPYVIGRLFP